MTTIDEKYEDEGYRNLMKNFAASAASGDLAGLEKGLAEVFLFQDLQTVEFRSVLSNTSLYHGV